MWLRVRLGRIWSLPSLLENSVGALSPGLEQQESKADHSFHTYGDHRCTSHGSSTSACALNRYNSSPAYFHIFTSSRIALCICDAVAGVRYQVSPSSICGELTPWCSWLRLCVTSQKVADSIPDGVIWIFNMHDPFRPHYVSELDSASSRNEYQEYNPRVKTSGTLGWQPYHLHVPIIFKSENLSVLETSGPVQACNGIALPIKDTKTIFFE